jgi:queuine tRNA-ribosyltransferase
MKEDGAYFKSYVDSTTICLSPERSIETQKHIGSDIMMVLDQCVPSTVDRSIAKDAMELTHRWAVRSLDARGDSPQSLFGIVQGACYTDLRIESAKVITDMDFDGFAIGGLAVGESMSERQDCTAIVTEHLPQDRPRYLMGVGTTLDILEAVHRGVDMFDCILPTSMAQQGKAFTSLGRRDLRRGVYKDLDGPLDPNCSCYTCKTYSLAYLYHINRVHESQAWQLLGIHNIHFYMQLTRTMREHILNDTWMPFYLEQREILDARDSYGPKSSRYAKVERAKKQLQSGDFEIRVDGDVSNVFNLKLGLPLQSHLNPLIADQQEYIELFNLIQTKPASPEDEDVIVWDIGLGTAAHAMSILHGFEKIPVDLQMRKLVMVSFDLTIDALHLVIKHASRFPHVHHPAPTSLLRNGSWQNSTGSLVWKLSIGEFKALSTQLPKPHFIFCDDTQYTSLN